MAEYGRGYYRDYPRRERGYMADRDYPGDRGFWERTGDEMMSWFGDEEAERRRRMDQRRDPEHTWHWRDHDQDSDEGDRYRSRYAGDRPDRHRGGRSSPYGPSYGTSYGSSYGYSGVGAAYGAGAYGAGSSYRARSYDPDYHSWRERQMERLDREYDDYCRERQARFDRDYETWRSSRAGSSSAANIREHMEVMGSDGGHVGTVDDVEGSYIRLTKSDKDAKGRHHMIPMGFVASVEADVVRLNCSADEAKREWTAQSH
jgi:hypothetical protein